MEIFAVNRLSRSARTGLLVVFSGLVISCGSKPDNQSEGQGINLAPAPEQTATATSQATQTNSTDLELVRLEILGQPRRNERFRILAVVRNNGPSTAKVAELNFRARHGDNYGSYSSDTPLARGVVRDLEAGGQDTVEMEASPISRSGFGEAYGYVKLLNGNDPNPDNDNSPDVRFVIQ